MLAFLSSRWKRRIGVIALGPCSAQKSFEADHRQRAILLEPAVDGTRGGDRRDFRRGYRLAAGGREAALAAGTRLALVFTACGAYRTGAISIHASLACLGLLADCSLLDVGLWLARKGAGAKLKVRSKGCAFSPTINVTMTRTRWLFGNGSATVQSPGELLSCTWGCSVAGAGTCPGYSSRTSAQPSAVVVHPVSGHDASASTSASRPAAPVDSCSLAT